MNNLVCNYSYTLGSVLKVDFLMVELLDQEKRAHIVCYILPRFSPEGSSRLHSF